MPTTPRLGAKTMQVAASWPAADRQLIPPPARMAKGAGLRDTREAQRTSAGAYAYWLGGACGASHQLQLVASLRSLLRSRPIFPVLVLLGSACFESKPLMEELDLLRVHTRRSIGIPGVRCKKMRLPPSTQLYARPAHLVDSARGSGFGIQPSATASYFDATWSVLEIWNQTQYDALLYMDSDVAVVRNLDHVLKTMLASPALDEFRTPQGCCPAGAAAHYLNTGVWGVRPTTAVFDGLSAGLRDGSQKCGIGFQTAAEQMLSNSWFRKRFNMGGIGLLHAGYNAKADKGVTACLHKLGINQTGLHTVHWSGSPGRKPRSLVLAAGKDEKRLGSVVPDALEREALISYIKGSRHLASRLKRWHGVRTTRV